MKKVNIFILSLILIFSITTSSAAAEGITIKKYKGYVYRVDGTEVVNRKKHPYWSVPSYITITDYKGNKKSITIPQKIKTANKIERHKKKKLFVPKKLRKAKVEAVEGYGNLEGIHVPAGVELRNLWKEEKLKKITVSKKHKLYSEKNNLLYNKKKTTLVSAVCEKTAPNIAKSVKILGENSLAGAEFSEFVIPPKVKKIDYYAFAEAQKLNKIVWNNCIEEIGQGAFYGCSSLQEIIIPDSVTTINWDAFKNCTSLYSVELGKNISFLPSCFAGCTSLKELKIPETLKTISKAAVGGGIEDLYVYNKDCKFYYSKKDEDKCSVSSTVTIHGYKGSTAEEYAKKNGNNFVALD